MSKNILPLILVEIDRGEEVVTTKVTEHEIPILKVIHGPDSVTVADDDTGEEIELDEGAESEFRRLQRKYRRINAPDLVLRAYPNGSDSMKSAGFKSSRDGKVAGPAHSASRVRPPAKKSEAKTAETEKAELHAKLDKLGVQYDKRSGVEKLREQVAEAEKAAK